jgi:sulfate adenylyltransferase subunit 1 (EFTu-like GTPase family)
MNDIAHVSIALAQPVFVDSYGLNRATGSFILIDEATNQTVAAGMIDG